MIFLLLDPLSLDSIWTLIRKIHFFVPQAVFLFPTVDTVVGTTHLYSYEDSWPEKKMSTQKKIRDLERLIKKKVPLPSSPPLLLYVPPYHDSIDHISNHNPSEWF
jgi:hypothetical protein